MKRFMTVFFILLTVAGTCALQGCGKKSSPRAVCNVDMIPEADIS